MTRMGSIPPHQWWNPGRVLLTYTCGLRDCTDNTYQGPKDAANARKQGEREPVDDDQWNDTRNLSQMLSAVRIRAYACQMRVPARQQDGAKLASLTCSRKFWWPR